jgi:polyvinyl alcohol dehydrogenase (cytochrome)
MKLIGRGSTATSTVRIQASSWIGKKKRKRDLTLFLAVLALSAATIACGVSSPCQSPGWLQGGADLHNTRFQCAETIINTANVGRLVPRWQQEMPGDVSATPSTDGKSVYFPDWGGYLNALSAETGAVLWQQPVGPYLGVALAASRTTPAIVDNGAALIIGASTEGGPPASIIKIDATSGATI